MFDLLTTCLHHLAVGTLVPYLRLRHAQLKHLKLRSDLWCYLGELAPYVDPFLRCSPHLPPRGLPKLRRVARVPYPSHLEPTPTVARLQRQRDLADVAGVLLAFDLLDREHIVTLERALQEVLDFKV